MNFKFECPKCGQHIAAAIQDAGTVGTCPTCNAQFTVPDAPPTGRVVPQQIASPAEPAPQPNQPSHLARNIRASLILLVLVCCLGFFHIVTTGDGVSIIPKAGFTFSDTFISVDDVIQRYNKRTLGDAFHSDPQFDHLVRQLENRELISKHKKTWNEVESDVRRSLPDR